MFLDVAIDVSIDRLIRARHVLHRDARHFDDSAFDGVDQREIADHPWEQRAFRLAGAAQVERRGGQIIDLHRHLRHALQRLDAVDPQPGFGSAFIDLCAGLRVQLGRVLLGAVAVVRLIVQHNDPPAAQQVLADTLDHRALGLRHGHRAVPAAEDFLGQLRRLDRLARLENVEIGDDDARALQPVAQLRRDDVMQRVGVVRIGGQQHAQPVSHRDAGGDDQEPVGEAR